MAAYSKPVRIELITGVLDALDVLAARLSSEVNPLEDTQPDPSPEATSPGSQAGGSDDPSQPGAADSSGSSDEPGAEVATAPGEPGVVTPGA